MNTENEILFCLIKLAFTDKINDEDIEKLQCIKRRLVIEVEDYNISTIIYALYLVDEINVITMTKDLGTRLEKTDCLRETNLFLISFKNFVGNAKEIE